LGETELTSETEQILEAIESILQINHQEWRQLAIEKATFTERKQRLLALDDRAVKLLELLDRKWKLDDETEDPATPSVQGVDA
jgi:hypothetical protein